MERTAFRPVELIPATLIFLLVSIAVFGRHVLHGGFYSDDWGNAATYRFAPSPRYFSAVGDFERDLGGRPILALLLPIPHALFGDDPGLHLGFAVALGVVLAVSLYAFLRLLELDPAASGVVSLLALFFPWADSTRLWATAGLNQVAVSFYLVGAATALRGLSERGRKAVVVHGVAIALFVVSVLTYEVAAPAALLTGALYLRRTERRRAFAFWSADAIAVGGALIYEAVATASVRHVASVGERLADLPHFTRDSLSVLATAFVPPTEGHPLMKGAVLATVVIVVTIAAARRRDPAVKRWLAIAAVGTVAVVAASTATVGSGLFPLYGGGENRINLFASVGFATFVFAVLVLASLLFVPDTLAVRSVAPIAAALLIVFAYAHDVRADAASWDRAARLQDEALADLRRTVPSPKHGSTIYTFGLAGEVGPGIPIFFKTWDLDGAVKLLYDDPSLHAYPIYGTGRLLCEPMRVQPAGGKTHFRTKHGARYGSALAVGLPSGKEMLLQDRAACRSVRSRFHPGPLLVGKS